MRESELNLGDLVQDKVTGLKGIATSKTEFLNGCIQVEVTPRLKENDLGAVDKNFGIGIDIQQLKRIGCGINTVARERKEPKKELVGGSMKSTSRSAY